MSNVTDKLSFKHQFTFECFDKDGNLKWKEEGPNLIVNTGLDDILDKFWKGSAYTASFFVGLVSATPTVAAADTMASHAGWTEVTNYSEANRLALTLGAVSGQSVSTSSAASFSINATVSIGGGFITTNNTKGGSTGTLIGAKAFTGGNKSADSGDTLNVNVTISATSS